MARPEKIENKADKFAVLRLSETDKVFLNKKAKELGTSRHRYMKEAVLNYHIENSPRIHKQYIADLRKIGVNINQITKSINIIAKNGEKINIEFFLNELNLLRKQLIDLYKIVISEQPKK